MYWVLLVIGAISVTAGLITNTSPGLTSKFLFKVYPVFSGLFVIYVALQGLGFVE